MADVIIWDGGNNDFSFYVSDYTITVTDPLRAGDEVRYHPSEVNVRTADAIVINKVNVADEQTVEKVIESCQKINAKAKIFKVRSEESVDKPHLIRGEGLGGGGRPFNYPWRALEKVLALLRHAS